MGGVGIAIFKWSGRSAWRPGCSQLSMTSPLSAPLDSSTALWYPLDLVKPYGRKATIRVRCFGQANLQTRWRHLYLSPANNIFGAGCVLTITRSRLRTFRFQSSELGGPRGCVNLRVARSLDVRFKSMFLLSKSVSESVWSFGTLRHFALYI